MPHKILRKPSGPLQTEEIIFTDLEQILFLMLRELINFYFPWNHQ